MTIKNSELFNKLKRHVLDKWSKVIDIVIKGDDGSYFFIKTTPPENKKSENKLSMVLMNSNKSVYMCFSDHKDGVFERLKNKNTDGTYFIVANDDNKVSGEHVFGKDNGSKLTPKEVNYLNLDWETGSLVK